MTAFLKAIDNPLLDLELLALMMSALYGFTPDELAKIRISDRRSSLYGAVLKCAESGDRHCRELVSDLQNFRMLASSVTADELIRRIYDLSAIIPVSCALGNGEQRRANLMLLLDYASGFESSGYRGLSAFVQFIERLQNGKGAVNAGADISEDDNTVKVMTIHKSKGLEFPFCIIAGLTTGFKQSDTGTIFVNDTAGIGFDIKDTDTLIQYPTVQSRAVKTAKHCDEMAEQIRALYVAMTRAREKLIIVATLNNLNSRLLKSLSPAGGKLGRYFVYSKNNQFEMLLPCILNNKNAQALRDRIEFSYGFHETDDYPLELNIFYKNSVEQEAVSKGGNNSPKANVPNIVFDEIKENIEYVYPYLPLTRVASKAAASRLKLSNADDDFFASDVPAFMSKDGMTGAQRGTATHKFLQRCDFSTFESVEKEIEKLKVKGLLNESEEKNLDKESLRAFFDSELFNRIKKSNCVNREWSFAINVPAEFFDESLPKEFRQENVLVQGAIDCFFEEDGEIVVVDYKTDRVKNGAELAERYSSQLEMYRRAAFECTGKKVKECVIYSLRLKKCININEDN